MKLFLLIPSVYNIALCVCVYTTHLQVIFAVTVYVIHVHDACYCFMSVSLICGLNIPSSAARVFLVKCVLHIRCRMLCPFVLHI
jgi:hypothetical protein